MSIGMIGWVGVFGSVAICSIISAKHQPMLIVETMIGLEIDIVEKSCRKYLLFFFFLSYTGNGSADDVDIGASYRHQKRTFFADYRAFQEQLGRNKTYLARAMKFIQVTVPHINLYHRGQPSSVPRRESPFGNTDAFDGIG